MAETEERLTAKQCRQIRKIAIDKTMQEHPDEMNYIYGCIRRGVEELRCSVTARLPRGITLRYAKAVLENDGYRVEVLPTPPGWGVQMEIYFLENDDDQD